jgi:hypothetical protein
VVHLNRAHQNDVYFDESLDRLEDYEFLLRLGQHGGFNFKQLDSPVAEHRVRKDGSNSVLMVQENPCEKNAQLWKDCFNEVERRKKTMTVTLSQREISDKLKQMDEKPEKARSNLPVVRSVLVKLNQWPRTKECIRRVVVFVLKPREMIHRMRVGPQFKTSQASSLQEKALD